MKYTYLGKIGLKVSRLCLGTMNFGPHTDEKECFAIMDRALEAGINFFDTADGYGKRDGRGYPGWTEEIMGRWFMQGGNRREKVVLATKVYSDMEDEVDGPNSARGISAYKIYRNLDRSLKRLRTDYVELYQTHHIYRHTTWEELWGAFESVVNQGKAYYIGSCNFPGWHIVQAQAEAAKRNFLGLVSEQHKYSLVCRLPELEVLPAVQETGIGLIAYSPLGAGMLSGNVFNSAPGTRGAQRMNSFTEKERWQIEEYSKLCADFGESEANVALAWVLSNPAVTAPIIGPRTVAQLEDSLKAIEIELPDDVLKKLDEIFPGPGGKAPEAYAW